MDRLHRFHRRKKNVPAPTLITNDLPRKQTPQSEQQAEPPMRSLRGLSPFRRFHRSSGKRARDSPPASLPHSPAEALALAGDGADGRPVSPLSLKTDPPSDEGQKLRKPPKMPAFLEQSPQEIENKFSELVWRERDRVMQSISNPSPDFRWARVTGPHLRRLDRYMNIQPWHNNRVKLHVPDGHVDYINASPIVLTPMPLPGGGPPREPDRYIAMQGPKKKSTDHVWRMVVEQLESPGVIVMLTETHEGNMEKCYQYFPLTKESPPMEINEHDEFGDGFRVTVRCEGLEETPAGDAIELRKLVIRVHSPSKGTMEVAPRPADSPELAEETGERDADDDVEMRSSPPPPPPPSPPPPFSSATTPSEITITTTTSSSSSSSSTPNLQANTTTTPPLDATTTTHSLAPQPDTTDEPPYEQEKIVYHFLYKKWPDFGVPSLSDLDSFLTLMRLSREKNASQSNPRIVHCSAGVGRSGTFIALEYLMREMDAGVLEGWDERGVRRSGSGGPLLGGGGGGLGLSSQSSLSGLSGGAGGGNEDGEGAGCGGNGVGGGDGGGDDGNDQHSGGATAGEAQSPSLRGQGEDLVFLTVDRLREQRKMMVQAESQYLFIYQVLRKLWTERYGSVSDDSGTESDGEPAAKRVEVDPFVAG
ncbi:hypothetical protein VTI74DRAFT_5672 [Chaetomium olivicolor]